MVAEAVKVNPTLEDQMVKKVKVGLRFHLDRVRFVKGITLVVGLRLPMIRTSRILD